jgi:hypothetical protein
VAAKREAEGKAIGGACRHAGRAIEDCYTLNRKVDKGAMFAGWREMNDYMRENKIEVVAPVLPPPGAPASAPKAAAAGRRRRRTGRRAAEEGRQGQGALTPGRRPGTAGCSIAPGCSVAQAGRASPGAAQSSPSG